MLACIHQILCSTQSACLLGRVQALSRYMISHLYPSLGQHSAGYHYGELWMVPHALAAIDWVSRLLAAAVHSRLQQADQVMLCYVWMSSSPPAEQSTRAQWSCCKRQICVSDKAIPGRTTRVHAVRSRHAQDSRKFMFRVGRHVPVPLRHMFVCQKA